MNLNVLIPLLAFIIYALLLLVVVREQAAASRVNRVFTLHLLAMTVWSFGSFMMHANFWPDAVLKWNKLMSIGVLGLPITFFYFVQAFLGKIINQKKWLYIGIISYVLLQFANFMGYMIPSGYVSEGIFHFELGPAVPFMALNYYFFFGYAIFSLVRQYRQEKDKIYRNRINYLLIGISLVVVGTLTNFTPLGKYPIDIASNLINALLITYAIVRHELLDINIVVRKTLAYSTLTGILALTYLLPIWIFHLIIYQQGSEPSLPNTFFFLVIGAGLVISIQPLYAAVKAYVDRWFFRERYDAYQMVRELGHEIAATLDLDKLGAMVANRITETLHIERVGIVLSTEETGEFYLVVGRGLDPRAAHLNWRPDHPVIRWLAQEQRILTRRALGILPQMRGLSAREEEELVWLGGEVFVPLRVKNELKGILMVGPKQSADVYSAEDHHLLTTFSNQVAVAVENARLYAESESRTAQLQASLKEKEVLLKEIHHRVKNNLQVVSSLLDLQVGHLKDEQVRMVLQESQDRIQSMALIHEHLYQSHDLAKIQFDDYVNDLVTCLFHTYQVGPGGVVLKMDIDNVALDIDRAVPCGLIINELVSNSLKYAFPSTAKEKTAQVDEARIELSLHHNHQITLLVHDNGVGLPHDFDVRKSKSLGLQLVNMLTKQLKGTLEVERNGGTTFKIAFSK